MRQLVIILVLIAIVTGCRVGSLAVHKSDNCQSYYDLIKEEWIKYDGYYQFSNNPNYLESSIPIEQYFKDTCMSGLNERDLIRLLGEPNKVEPSKKDWSKYIYCLDDKCSGKWKFYLDPDKTVGSSDVSPFLIDYN